MLNPVSYRAEYFGEKVHFDQNEKLLMYGVVHIVAVDGVSRKIVGFVTMSCKNPITIFNTIYTPLLFSQGIWTQLRSDHGTELVLISTVQCHLASHQVDQQPMPVLQSTSRENHRAERIWPEVNSHINYPIKRVLVRMEAEEIIDMRSSLHKFAVSWVTIHLIESLVTAFVTAWNSHTIPGSVPDTLADRTCRISPLSPSQIPSVHEAVTLHESTNGRLTPESTYGIDPLEGNQALKHLHERDFFCAFPSMEVFFSNNLHSNGKVFQRAILFFISLCTNFTALTEM